MSNNHTKILLIEDNPSDARLISKLLTAAEEQFEPECADCLSDGLKLLSDKSVDAIILDLLLPDSSGFETFDNVQKNAPNIPIIVLTGNDDEELAKKALRKGAQDYLIKGQINKNLLERSLRYSMERKRSEEVLRKAHDELQQINEKLSLELSERTLLAEALHENEQQFRTLVANLPGAVYRCMLDKNNTMEYISDAIEKISGYPTHEFLYNRVRTYSSIVLPEDFEKREKVLKEGMDPLKSFEVEYRIFDADGKIHWLSETGQAIYSNEGIPLCIDGAIFDESETKFAQEALKEANQKLHRLAVIDGLTQIANRRKFDESIETEWKRLQREKEMLSLIICDIDFFKPFNDNYGHQAGDKCLHKVAQKIATAIHRPADLAARYGGEEFAVILPNTGAGGAIHVAERIRQEVYALKIEHAHSEVEKYITLSLGVSSIVPSSDLSQEALINAADKALYEAKEQGRNRAILSK